MINRMLFVNHKRVNKNLGPITVNKILKEKTSSWTKLDEDQITLPSWQQIATAVGDTEWTEGHSTGTKLPTWLHSYTKTPVTYGYWTSSTKNNHDAYRVYAGGTLSGEHSEISGGGVRPVITISKSNLS